MMTNSTTFVPTCNRLNISILQKHITYWFSQNNTSMIITLSIIKMILLYQIVSFGLSRSYLYFLYKSDVYKAGIAVERFPAFFIPLIGNGENSSLLQLGLFGVRTRIQILRHGFLPSSFCLLINFIRGIGTGSMKRWD